MASDQDLLSEYLRDRSSIVFGRLVERHTPLVYSTCLRVLGDPHAAEDATQATFLVLVRRAAQLPARLCLPPWLYGTALRCARSLRKSNRRRTRREQEASAMNPNPPASPRDASWENLEGQVDAALSSLTEPYRDALLLRYVLGQSEAEAARGLGCSPATLHVRVTRALAKVREFLARRRVSVTPVILVGLLTSHAVQAAPSGLAASVTAACLGTKGASATALGVANSIAKSLAWWKAKTVIAIAAVAVAAPTAYGIHRALQPPPKPTAPVMSSPASAKAQESDELPSGAQVLFRERFSATTAQWTGKVAQAPEAVMGDFAIQTVPLSNPKFSPPFLGEVRTPLQERGWPVGPRTYLRFRYRGADGVTEKDRIKLMFKRADLTNFSGFLPKIVCNRWQTVTVSLTDNVGLDDRPAVRLASGEKLHQLIWMGRNEGDVRTTRGSLWIDDVVLFESPSELDAVVLEQE